MYEKWNSFPPAQCAPVLVTLFANFVAITMANSIEFCTLCRTPNAEAERLRLS